MMMVDIGRYNAEPKRYQELVDEIYERYPDITLPPEYAYFVEANMLHLLIRLARYKFVARLIKKTDRVLEIGCGSGMGGIFLSQHCAHVTGIDVKTTEIEAAHSINRRSNAEFKVADLFELEETSQYDVVIALDVIEHMPIEYGHKLVAEMARHLKPTGMLVIGTPSIYSYEYQSETSKASHVKCYDQAELVTLIEEYFGRTLAFSMNDEVVHTGFSKMAWYYFVLAFLPRISAGD
jgi:2-polyprenyl-3-methyl-5-hydroxy-6-metoxy-1,4-benzoquinol methylase